MSRRHIFAISIGVAVVLAAAFALLTNVTANDPGVAAWLKGQSWLSTPKLILALVAFVIASAVLAIWQYWNAGTPERVAESNVLLSPAFRLRLLDKIKNERIDPRLSQGLRKALRVDLGLTETPGAVQPRLQLYSIAEAGNRTERPISGSIQDIFEKASGGQLLILGDPGTGKTNLLLELADGLIKRAKRDEAYPIPVVFNLPRWTLGNRVRALGEWLKDDLAREYGLSRATADALITQDHILPLLDGLDEVSHGLRAACADAIIAFQKDRDLGRVVVCCRTTEYASIPKLELGTAVRVEKLGRADIERETVRPGLKRVRRALESDPELWGVIDTPLWLHVLYAASQIQSPKSGKNADPRDRLYARYVEYALDRKMDSSPRKRTARGPMLRWLGWLAAEMRRRGQTQFFLEDLNATWISSKSASRSVRWLPSLVSGLVFALVFVLIFVLVGGLTGILSVGVPAVFGLLFALRANFPSESGEVHFSWRGFRNDLLFGLACGLFLGLLFGLALALGIGLVWGLIIGLSFGLTFGLGFAQMSGLGFREEPESQCSTPNRATLNSLHYAFRIVLSTLGLALFFLFSLFSLRRLSHHDRVPHFDRVLSLQSAMIVVFGFNDAMSKGGDFALTHYIARLFLWRFRVAPLRYVRFLNEADERLFLIRHGGSYEFLHVTFRDYMADAHGPT